MINKDDFFLHKDIVDWLLSNRICFSHAMAIVSYADSCDMSIPRAFHALMYPNTTLSQICNDESDEEDDVG